MNDECCRICSTPLSGGLRTREGGCYARCGGCGSEHRILGETSAAELFARSQDKYHSGTTAYHLPVVGEIGARKGAARASKFAQYAAAGSRVLEVGPGSGFFLGALAEKGYRVEGIEHSRDFADSIVQRVGVPVHVGELEHATFDDTYDAVASFHVIEHVDEPLRHLEALARVTSPGGHLLLATPNAGGFQHRVLRHLSPQYSEAHLNLLTAQGMMKAMEKAGWQVLESSTNEAPEDMLRGFSAVFKLILGRPPGSALAQSFTRASASRLIQVFSAVSLPVRLLLARLGRGNELLIVARRA